MGDWIIQRQQDYQGSDIDWEGLGILGQQVYSRYDFKRKHNKYYKEKLKNMSRNATGSVYPSGYEGDALITSKPRVRTCKRVSGRNRPIRVQSIVKQLMNEVTLLFQSVRNDVVSNNNGWRITGTNALNSRYTLGGASSWPRTLLFPVYVYRLSAAVGNQLNDVSGAITSAFPLIQYRLEGTQNIDGDTWIYRWTPVSPTNNSDPTYTTWNSNNIIEKETPFNSDKIYHESTYAKILLTGPTFNTVNFNIDVIQFNEEEYAPPDDYWTSVGGSTSLSIDHGFIGPSDENLLNEYYSTWLFNKATHPCVATHKPRGLHGPRPFTILKRHSMAIGNRDTATQDTGGPQYLHEQVLKEHRWHNTYIPASTAASDGPDVDPNGGIDQAVQDLSRACGVFPNPTKCKWLMVSSFGTPALPGGTLPGAVALLPTGEASFDISIRSKFKCVNTN